MEFSHASSRPGVACLTAALGSLVVAVLAPPARAAPDAGVRGIENWHFGPVPSQCSIDSLRASGQRASTPAPRDSLPEALSGARGSKGDVSALYAKAAPAVVIVESVRGYGTGVLIQSQIPGLVLTNHHVVADGEDEGLRKKLRVRLGKPGPNGSMVPDGDWLSAYVLKWDPLLDLAAIRIVDPPASLTGLPLAPPEHEPRVGQSVAAIGHGAIGLLWAIKDGNIDAIGTLADQLALLGATECPAQKAETSVCKRREAMRDFYRRTTPALLIQSSCAVSPGDSGGPLLNPAGELVGLNDFVKQDTDVAVTTNYHIHVSTIRDFLAAGLPKDPPPLPPDPWAQGGSEGAIGDADLDGVFDTLVLREPQQPRFAVFFDVRQRTLPRGANAAVAELVGNRTFKADAVILREGERVLAWYDTDGDDRLDLLLVSKPDGTVQSSWLLEGATWQAAKQPRAQRVVARLFRDATSNDRLDRLARVALPPPLRPEKSQEVSTTSLPDLLAPTAREGAVVDVDGDGKPDTLVFKGLWSSTVLIDGEQRSLLGLSVGKGNAPANLRAVRPSIALVREVDREWVFSEPGGDGTFRRACASSDEDRAICFEPSRIEKGVKGPAVTEDAGRLLYRPQGISKPAAQRVQSILKKVLGDDVAVARDDAIGSFPLPELPKPGAAQAPRIPGWEGAVLTFADESTQTMWLDLARKAKTPSQAELAKATGAPPFRPSFAWVHRSAMEWTFYDSNGDGKFDVVLFAAEPRNGLATRGWRLSPTGAATLDPSLEGKRLVSPSLLQTSAAKQFRSFAQRVFAPTAVEP